jgi:hypothetical protein
VQAPSTDQPDERVPLQRVAFWTAVGLVVAAGGWLFASVLHRHNSWEEAALLDLGIAVATVGVIVVIERQLVVREVRRHAIESLEEKGVRYGLRPRSALLASYLSQLRVTKAEDPNRPDPSGPFEDWFAAGVVRGLGPSSLWSSYRDARHPFAAAEIRTRMEALNEFLRGPFRQVSTDELQRRYLCGTVAAMELVIIVLDDYWMRVPIAQHRTASFNQFVPMGFDGDNVRRDTTAERIGYVKPDHVPRVALDAMYFVLSAADAAVLGEVYTGDGSFKFGDVVQPALRAAPAFQSIASAVDVLIEHLSPPA